MAKRTEKDFITYSNIRNYKYRLVKRYEIQTKLRGFEGPATQHGAYKVKIYSDGVLVIYKGYLWDGPSGIARDTKSFMRASLVHDALYHLMREGILPRSKRRYADSLMRTICHQDGMNPARATTVFLAVRVGGRRSAIHDKPIKVMIAPRKR